MAMEITKNNVLILLLLVEATFTMMSGLFGRKEWFWRPSLVRKIHPFLSFRFSHNDFIYKFSGRAGLISFSVVSVLFFWIVCILIITHG